MWWIKEIRNNPGLLPKILVIIYRLGYFIHFKVKIPVIKQLLYFIYRLLDLLVVKLLLNCDLLGSVKIGPGLTVYHPYGIIINDSAVIGSDFTVRAQVMIGNKGEQDQQCPVIGDNVDVGIGAKIIGGVKVGEDSIIGTNTVVTRSFPAKSILVGAPARNINSRKK